MIHLFYAHYFMPSLVVSTIGQPEMEIKMLEKRKYAASVALDQSKLWELN